MHKRAVARNYTHAQTHRFSDVLFTHRVIVKGGFPPRTILDVLLEDDQEELEQVSKQTMCRARL